MSNVKKKVVNRTAEAFIFSGRPNPQWKLSAAQMKYWVQQWDNLPGCSSSAERISKLGYTGCLLHQDDHSHWIIFNGCVSFYKGREVISKEDKGRQLEFWLLSMAPEEIRKLIM